MTLERKPYPYPYPYAYPLTLTLTLTLTLQVIPLPPRRSPPWRRRTMRTGATGSDLLRVRRRTRQRKPRLSVLKERERGDYGDPSA